MSKILCLTLVVLVACCSSVWAQSILVACYDSGKVEQFGMDGSYIGTFATPTNKPVAVIQGADGYIYVGGGNFANAGGVSRYAVDGTLLNDNLITGVTAVADLAWANGKLWLTDYYGHTAAYDPATGLQSGPSTTIAGNPYAIKVGPDGLVYVATMGSGQLLAWDTVLNTTTEIATAKIGDANDALMSLAWNGNDLYVGGNSTWVYKYVPGTGLVGWAQGNTSGLGIAIYGDTLYRAASNTGQLKAFSLADGSTVFDMDISAISGQVQQICVAVPEPSSLLALAAGAAGLVGFARRRRS